VRRRANGEWKRRAGSRKDVLQSMVNNYMREHFGAMVGFLGSVDETTDSDDEVEGSDSDTDREVEWQGRVRPVSLSMEERRAISRSVLGHPFAANIIEPVADLHPMGVNLVSRGRRQRRTPLPSRSLRALEGRTCTYAHFQIALRSVPDSIRGECADVRDLCTGSILRLVRLRGLAFTVAEVRLYKVRTDPKTHLPYFTPRADNAIVCWLDLSTLGPVVAIGRGAPGLPYLGSAAWTVLPCTPCMDRCTATSCLCN
jgi:hypothetical protein